MTCSLCHWYRRYICAIACLELCAAPKSWLHRHIVADDEDSLRYDAIGRELEREGR